MMQSHPVEEAGYFFDRVSFQNQRTTLGAKKKNRTQKKNDIQIFSYLENNSCNGISSFVLGRLHLYSNCLLVENFHCLCKGTFFMTI